MPPWALLGTIAAGFAGLAALAAALMLYWASAEHHKSNNKAHENLETAIATKASSNEMRDGFKASAEDVEALRTEMHGGFKDVEALRTETRNGFKALSGQISGLQRNAE